MPALSLEARIEELVRVDRRYAVEAYQFVFEALDFVAAHPGRRRGGHARGARHIAVTELLDGFRQLGLEQFGPLARCVFESWGVYSTDDFGEIVFKLIEHDLLNQGEHDRKEDFKDGFDFREAFEEGYRPRLRMS
jgi:uncharacterized repeat protein (TIGR04138 family)